MTPASFNGPFSPQDLRRAYSIPTNGSQAAVTIVDAYANPRVADSLRIYETQFGLPHLPGCRAGVNVPCFQYQNLAGSITNEDWDEEGFLDIQMVRMACQTCSIRYVAARSNSLDDMDRAVDIGRAPLNGCRITAVSMSWSSGEWPTETSSDSHYSVPGVAMVAASGDDGYLGSGPQYPAVSRNVISVGGTSLIENPSHYYDHELAWSDSYWSGAGSGCSAYEPYTPIQHSYTQCSHRAATDISAVANPFTGVFVWVPTQDCWYLLGGTSVATPIIAGMAAASGIPAGVWPKDRIYNAVYKHLPVYHDPVRAGQVGIRWPNVWSLAGPGWDGPTGLGTPKGLRIFQG